MRKCVRPSPSSTWSSAGSVVHFALHLVGLLGNPAKDGSVRHQRMEEWRGMWCRWCRWWWCYCHSCRWHLISFMRSSLSELKCSPDSFIPALLCCCAGVFGLALNQPLKPRDLTLVLKLSVIQWVHFGVLLSESYWCSFHGSRFRFL